VEDGGGGDVDALGDLGVLVAEQLHAQQPPGGSVAGDPHGDAVAAGIVGLVVIGGGADGDRVESGRPGFVVAQAGAGRDGHRGQGEHEIRRHRPGGAPRDLRRKVHSRVPP